MRSFAVEVSAAGSPMSRLEPCVVDMPPRQLIAIGIIGAELANRPREAGCNVDSRPLGQDISPMTVLQSEVYEAFRAINVPEQEAVKAAAALSRRDDDVSSLKGELLVIERMMGFVLGFQLLIFGKLFMH